MGLVMKNDMEELVKERLSLPSDARISRADLRISDDSEDIQIIGKVLIEVDGEVEEGTDFKAAEALPKTRGRKAGKRGPKSKKASKADREPSTGASISDKDVKIMRAKLAVLKTQGKLNENQLSALKNLQGLRAPNLTIPQREQIRNIFEDATAS